jgi:dihydroorotate dehydrogenase (NAD+) catalytic subunit
MFNLLGKEIRGRFGFPSGVITTNSDIARYMFEHVPQFGFYQGKSTTIEPTVGNREDILTQPTPDSMWNAVGYTNPGLEATVEGFRELREATPDDVFLMAQVGESTEEKFAHSVDAFEQAGDIADGYEINVSCPHAAKGGILIGSDPESVRSITAATRKATRKPIIVKLNAGVRDFEAIALAAEAGGADAISAINTLGGPNPELSNQFGGLSGAAIFPSTLDAVVRIRRIMDLPIIAGGYRPDLVLRHRDGAGGSGFGGDQGVLPDPGRGSGGGDRQSYRDYAQPDAHGLPSLRRQGSCGARGNGSGDQVSGALGC